MAAPQLSDDIRVLPMGRFFFLFSLIPTHCHQSPKSLSFERSQPVWFSVVVSQQSAPIISLLSVFFLLHVTKPLIKQNS